MDYEVTAEERSTRSIIDKNANREQRFRCYVREIRSLIIISSLRSAISAQPSLICIMRFLRNIETFYSAYEIGEIEFFGPIMARFSRVQMLKN